MLGIYWKNAYVYTYIPFGSHHGTQIFRHLSDAVCYMMYLCDFQTIDYIDDQLEQIDNTVIEWNSKTVCTHGQLQSLLGYSF